MEATLKQIFTYPIKGLSAHSHRQVRVETEYGILGDRAFALMYVEGNDIPAQGQQVMPWLSKGHFLMQNDWPKLAALDCDYNFESGILTVRLHDKILLQASTKIEEERNLISAFFTGYLATLEPTATARHPQKAPVKLVGNFPGESRYPDRNNVHISLISQETIEAISEAANYSLNVERFRPNFVITGVPAWEEFNWCGQELMLGNIKIAVTARIGRCVNIDVNQTTGEQDLELFSLLPQKFGHAQTGVVAKVISGGSVAVGDTVSLC